MCILLLDFQLLSFLSEYFENSSRLLLSRLQPRSNLRAADNWHGLSHPKPSVSSTEQTHFASWKWLKVKDRWNQYRCTGLLGWQVACIRYQHQQQIWSTALVHCWLRETAGKLPTWRPTANSLQLWMLFARPFWPVYCSALLQNNTTMAALYFSADGWIER